MDFAVDKCSLNFQGKVKYVVRPVLPSGCETKSSHCAAVGASDTLNLGGYGVELALKNMEYKAMDDSAIKKGACLTHVSCWLDAPSSKLSGSMVL